MGKANSCDEGCIRKGHFVDGSHQQILADGVWHRDHSHELGNQKKSLVGQQNKCKCSYPINITTSLLSTDLDTLVQMGIK